MDMFVLSGPTIAVSAIYCAWNGWFTAQRRRQRLLRERVAYMLWMASDRAA